MNLKKVFAGIVAFCMLFSFTGGGLVANASSDASSPETTLIYEEIVTYEDGEISTYFEDGEVPTTHENGEITPLEVIGDGGFNWKLIDRYYGNSKITDTIAKYTAHLAAGAAGAYFSKIAAIFAGATFNTFYTPPKTRYYTTSTYQDRDRYYIYTKFELKVYSDSKRKNLISKRTQVHRSAR